MQNPETGLLPPAGPAGPRADAAPAWCWVGERGLRVATGEATLACYEALRALRVAEVEDVIPADGSVLLVLRRGMEVSADLQHALAHLPAQGAPASGALHTIRVEYGGTAGPDLAALAARAGLAIDEYVERHAAADYTVAFLGFQPGFPYLRGLPPGLHAPRRDTPRVRVAAGSVAIGGGYTGIYPAAGPGGWHLIGRTHVVLFNARRAPPALLRPGDRVRLVPA
jgi:KipI family sensor histidine kinase inhibitor